MEDGFQHPQWPLRVPGHAVWSHQRTSSVSGLVNDVLRDMLNRFVFVYLDDILIFSKSQQEHVQHVKQVLHRLLENQLIEKAEKCEFHVSTVSFLGFVVSDGHVHMDPAKVKAVVDCPIFSGTVTPFSGIRQFLPTLHPKLQLHSSPVDCPHLPFSLLHLDP